MHPPKILIVDDSRVMRLFIRRVLACYGVPDHSLTEAASGEEALAYLNSASFDLILTDINMPGMDGETMLQTMANSLNETPVIVISSDSTESRRQRMFALGARAYLPKPFSPEALGEELQEFIPQELRA